MCFIAISPAISLLQHFFICSRVRHEFIGWHYADIGRDVELNCHSCCCGMHTEFSNFHRLHKCVYKSQNGVVHGRKLHTTQFCEQIPDPNVIRVRSHQTWEKMLGIEYSPDMMTEWVINFSDNLLGFASFLSHSLNWLWYSVMLNWCIFVDTWVFACKFQVKLY